MLMESYDQALRNALASEYRQDRTGVGTYSKFGERMEFDMSLGFPAITTKKLAWKAVVSELLWFLEGSTDERRLAEILYGRPREELVDKKTIWTANTDAFFRKGKTNVRGEAGRAYGAQFRRFGQDELPGVNQVANLVEGLRADPLGRRHLISLWDPNYISEDDVALPPCHVLSQFYVSGDSLSCQYYMRSNDLFLGAPFNIASYALLTSMIAYALDFKPGKLIQCTGDSHVYADHVEQVKIQLAREHYPAPKLKFNCSKEELLAFLKGEVVVKTPDLSCFVLEGYESHPALVGNMAV
jgi:thymidylate synthase